MQFFLFLCLLSACCVSVNSFVPTYSPLKFQKVKLSTQNIVKPLSHTTSTQLNAVSAVAASQSAVVTKAAIKSISKLLATCGIGIYAGKVKILDQTALSILSKLIFTIFQPCLLFVNVASTVAQLAAKSGGSQSSAAIYLLPFAAGFQIVVGYIVGRIVAMITNGGKIEDENAKQLLACTTFGNSGPLPLVFTDGLFRSHPDPTLLPKSVAYVSLYLLGWSPLFWIIGPAILKENDTSGKVEDKAAKMKELFSRIFSPPVVGSIFGMIVGFVPFLKNIFISSDGLLNPIFEAMRTLGAAYLPAVLLVLAGSLSQNSSSQSNETSQKSVDPKFVTKIASIYLARFLLMPVVGFAMFNLSAKFIPGARDFFLKDPLLLLVLLLETCMPSAQNTTVILQLQGNKGAAARLAQTLMIIYVLGVPAMSFWLIKILQLTGLAA